MRMCALLTAALFTSQTHAAEAGITQTRFEISFPAAARSEAATGRLFLMISRKNEPEVRLQDYWFNSPAFFGVDVDGWKPGQPVVVDERTLGYPFRSLSEIPPGDYFVQAALTPFRKYHRTDGHVVWALDQWDGHRFNASPGNLYSAVQKVHLDRAQPLILQLALANSVPRTAAPTDTPWVKHIKIQSKLLTQFWGQPIYLGATVLLPKDYSQGKQRYPVIYQQQAHFNLQPPFDFRTDNPPESADDRLQRNSRGYETGYEFYQSWNSGNFPRFIAVALQHPTPYGDLSAAMNSANNGPYGDAIVTELIPYIEKQFRATRDPSARMLVGKSAGGRDALAQQLHYPDFFGGAWIFYPWAFTGARYFIANVYEDGNLFVINSAPTPLWRGFWSAGEWAPLERFIVRTVDGQPVATMRQLSYHDAIIAGKRVGGEFGADDAILGPIGPNGYPRPLWDRMTGEIDPEVANYWREHSDLASYARSHWPTIGSKLVGKLHFYVGDMDEFSRHHGVHYLESILNGIQPNYGGSFSYAPFKGHGWQPMTNAELVRIMAVQVTQHAPAGISSAWNP